MNHPTDQFLAEAEEIFDVRMTSADQINRRADAAICDPDELEALIDGYNTGIAYDLARVMRELPKFRRGCEIARQAVREALTQIEGKLHAVAVRNEME